MTLTQNTKNYVFQYISESSFIEQHLKQNLIYYYPSLSEKQINKLFQHIQGQRKEALNILKNLKDTHVCSFENIKEQLESIKKNFMYQEELKEKMQDEAALQNLINTL
ncbi:hypothetical protein MK079_02990 [Candidatus Gracilibacteria bacterium]|nr:hypothetical protein [Candidatus Gracilibacteria bacterium]